VIVVLDASVLIGYLNPGDAHGPAAGRLLQEAAVRDDSLSISTVTLAEALVNPVRDGTDNAVLAAVEALEIAEVGFPPGAALSLARLRVDTGLKLPDCCVLLAALDRQAALASFDARLIDAAGQLQVQIAGPSDPLSGQPR
jgi:predicted nucleic acid-binding protein